MELVNINQKTTKLANPYIVKCILLGNAGVGKSTMLNVLTTNRFDPTYEATIGIDFATKSFGVDNNQTIKLQIWDTAGQEKFGNIIKSYLRDVCIAFLVFDITDRSSWDNLKYWKEQLDKNNKYNGIPTLHIVGTKSDLDGWVITESEIKELSDCWDCDYHIVSSKHSNIENMFKMATNQFHQLIEFKINNGYEIPDSFYIKFGLDDNDNYQPKQSCCFQ